MRILCPLCSDPKKDGLVELILQVGVEQLTEQQKETLVRQLAVLLNVLDSDVKVLKIQAHTDVRYDTYPAHGGTQVHWASLMCQVCCRPPLLSPRLPFLLSVLFKFNHICTPQLCFL